jgi:hypothetical protein
MTTRSFVFESSFGQILGMSFLMIAISCERCLLMSTVSLAVLGATLSEDAAAEAGGRDRGAEVVKVLLKALHCSKMLASRFLVRIGAARGKRAACSAGSSDGNMQGQSRSNAREAGRTTGRAEQTALAEILGLVACSPRRDDDDREGNDDFLTLMAGVSCTISGTFFAVQVRHAHAVF